MIAFTCYIMAIMAWPSQDDLIAQTIDFFNTKTGWYSPIDNSSFAIDDFVFRGPIVGPQNFDMNFNTVTNYGPHKGFPDLKPNPGPCWLDERDNEFGRHIYCVHYPTGTHTEIWHAPGGVTVKPTNRSIESSGEVWSVLWNKDMKVKMLTVGYPINAYRGNGCGYGAAFALLCLTGAATPKALKEGYILQWTFHRPKESTPYSELPEWWKKYCKGADCKFNL